MRSTRVTVVTVVHGRRPHLEAQRASLAAGSLRPDRHVVVAMGEPGLAGWAARQPADGVPVEVVPIPAHPDRLPLARARNVGVEAALAGGADVVVLLDVDCLAGPELVDGYGALVRGAPGVVWSGPVTYLAPPPEEGYRLDRLVDDPHPARPAPPPGATVVGGDWRLFWSLSFALSPAAWRATGGFCEEYAGYGGEDTDFGQAASAAGLELGWAGTPRAYHQHHPPQAQRRAADVIRNATLFHARWGWWPMEGWLAALERDGLATRRDGAWTLTQAVQTQAVQTQAVQTQAVQTQAVQTEPAQTGAVR